jgi:hypothetical protein
MLEIFVLKKYYRPKKRLKFQIAFDETAKIFHSYLN